MNTQIKNFLFWVGAILAIVLATLLYQPAAAKTGSLLVWTRDRVYVMDIDTLTLERVGPAAPGALLAPSPGCSGQAGQPCWVVIGPELYRVDVGVASSSVSKTMLPQEGEWQWSEEVTVSWAPDGHHLAYSLRHAENNRAELRIYDAETGQITLKAPDIDPTIPPAWSAECAAGVMASGCKLGYKRLSTGPNELPALVSYAPASQALEQWTISPEPIFELRWSPEGDLLYSRPKRHFINPEGHDPAYNIPDGSRLANLSPDAQYVIYYQPFTLEGCQPKDETDRCLHLGVWLKQTAQSAQNPALIYSIDLSSEPAPGLNFIPVWAPTGNSFVFFQEGQLIHYDLEKEEATIWYKNILGKLRSVPVFSPNENAVAFIDNQGQGHSEYRLVVVNPRLQSVEHIIDTEAGFRLLAWLPD